MKVGDMIKIVAYNSRADKQNQVGLVVNIERRYGADCNRHSRVATVMTAAGGLADWPVDSRYQIEVVSESR